QPVASSMPLHGLSVLVPTETEGLRRSAPTPRCFVSSNKTSEDAKAHHRENRPHMWETASHPPETGAHDVPPRQLRRPSAEGNSEKRKSAHSSPPQAVLSGRSTHQAGGSTLLEGYLDALTRLHACPHNVLLPFPPLHASAPSLKPHPRQIR
ncbi:hypothetical protein TcG_10723, partial [Trypanosoma cruzi]